jgi:hypothetical protein
MLVLQSPLTYERPAKPEVLAGAAAAAGFPPPCWAGNEARLNIAKLREKHAL